MSILNTIQVRRWNENGIENSKIENLAEATELIHSGNPGVILWSLFQVLPYVSYIT